MDKDLRNICILLKNHLHLTNDEIEAYIEGSLDRVEQELAAEHLSHCSSCAKEVDIIREAFIEDDVFAMSQRDQAASRKVVHFGRPRKTGRLWFWLGDHRYPLEPTASQPGVMRILGLSCGEFLEAQRAALSDPDSSPVSIEDSDPSPLLIPLSGRECIETSAEGRPGTGESLASVRVGGRSIDIFSPGDTDEVFLRIGELQSERSEATGVGGQYGHFGLDWLAASAVVSLQSRLVDEETRSDRSEGDRQKKIAWSKAWRSRLQREGVSVAAGGPEEPPLKILDQQDLKEALVRLRTRSIDRRLVLLEVIAFQPYEPLAVTDAGGGKCLRVDPEVRRPFLQRLSRELGLEESLPDHLDACLKSTVSSITGRRTKIVLAVVVGIALGALVVGAAAPLIGGLVGKAMGLKGAAARMAGLALLGGGAVAKGGFGVVGGTFVLVFGGALLGSLVGAITARIMVGRVPVNAIVEGAKLEVAMREFLLHGKMDAAYVQRLLFQQLRRIELIETEIHGLRIKGRTQARRIKDLERTLAILKKSLRRGQDMFAGAA
ncbi:MAG: hypothetical protein HY912_22295 [Desulfomonile tiedjei]|uniref:Zinc-finger domain-containing protein n=1 Tax=Desulfomonile tiedjei TaxID=2358 RepID=A0A9D6V7A9_9BACT|nr:hypothetical protein [Desulfomonile tiedjei]